MWAAPSLAIITICFLQCACLLTAQGLIRVTPVQLRQSGWCTRALLLACCCTLCPCEGNARTLALHKALLDIRPKKDHEKPTRNRSPSLLVARAHILSTISRFAFFPYSCSRASIPNGVLACLLPPSSACGGNPLCSIKQHTISLPMCSRRRRPSAILAVHIDEAPSFLYPHYFPPYTQNRSHLHAFCSSLPNISCLSSQAHLVPCILLLPHKKLFVSKVVYLKRSHLLQGHTMALCPYAHQEPNHK